MCVFHRSHYTLLDSASTKSREVENVSKWVDEWGFLARGREDEPESEPFFLKPNNFSKLSLSSYFITPHSYFMVMCYAIYVH